MPSKQRNQEEWEVSKEKRMDVKEEIDKWLIMKEEEEDENVKE